MKKLLITAAAIATASAIGAAAPAFAETYGSLGYSNTDIGPYNLDGVNGRAGWNNGILGVEGEATFGVGDDTSGANRARLDSNVGVFATATGVLTPDFSVMGRAGYGETQLKVNNVKNSDDGFAYGAGAQWTPAGGPNGVRVDYTKYDNDSKADVWSVGLVRKF